MAENLRTTKYRNGDEIPFISQDSIYGLLNSGAYRNPGNTIIWIPLPHLEGCTTDTLLLMVRFIAPDGWHIPSMEEWYLLLGNASADYLKETGNRHWLGMNSTASNETGFTALQQGYWSILYFTDIGICGF